MCVTIADNLQYCGEFDNWGAVMSVSGELLCSFELLKPLDSSALKSHIKKSRNKRQSMLNSPVSNLRPRPMDLKRSLVPYIEYFTRTDSATARALRSSKLLTFSFLYRAARAMDHQHRYLQRNKVYRIQTVMD
jgi:serine/threonine-protein phosphatase PP1 catalytic subunit